MSVNTPARASRSRARALARIGLAVVALAWLATFAQARDVIERSPYGPVLEALLERLYASEYACPVALDPDTRCFSIAPGTVAGTAESLSVIVAEFGGALALSEWTSANGVYHVEVRLSDDLWGALGLWLTESDGQVVNGRVLLLPRPRNGAP